MLESLLLNSNQMQRVRIHKLEIIIPDIELINGFCNLDENNTKLEEILTTLRKVKHEQDYMNLYVNASTRAQIRQ
jgi:hypothetical protein